MELLGALKEKRICNLRFNRDEQVLYFQLRRKLIQRVGEIFEIHKRALEFPRQAFIERSSIEVMPDAREVWVHSHYLNSNKIVEYSYKMIVEQSEKKLEKQLRKISL